MILNKKGQGALEYLMTYGFALLIIAIVIGVLIFMGILKAPSAGTCTGLEKLAYEDHTIDSNGNFMLFLRNGTGMQITDVEATPEGDFSGNCNASSATVNATKDFNVVCFNTGVSAGQTYAGKIRIEYKRRLAEHVETATCTGTAPLGGIVLVGGPLPGNQAPDANLTASAYSANIGAFITFYGNTSSDPDGNIVNYAWDFGDGNTVASGTSIMYHAYSGAGTKNIALTVTDNNGATDANTIGVSISAGSYTSLATGLNSQRKLVRNANGNRIYLIYENGGNPSKIYFTQSDNNGSTWSTPVNVSNNPAASKYPSIDINSSDGLHVVWMDYKYGNGEVLYKSCSGDCSNVGNWGVDVNVSNNSGSSGVPVIDINSTNGINVVWEDSTYGISEILYKSCSGDCGIAGNWSADVNVSNNSWASHYPSLDINSTDDLHIAWNEGIGGDNEILYKTCSKDCENYSNWSSDVNISNNPGISIASSIAISNDNKVHVVWHDDTSVSSISVRYKNCSSNCGASASWGDDFNVTDANGIYPTIAFDSYNNIYVLWMDDNATAGKSNINTRKRQSNGTWDANIIKTTDGNNNAFPNAAKSLLPGAPYSYLQYVYTIGFTTPYNVVFVSEAT